jgi:hypothetical protein
MANGMSFIGNRWVFTGPQSYVAEPANDGTADWLVYSVNAAGRRPMTRTTEGAARETAGILNDRHH